MSVTKPSEKNMGRVLAHAKKLTRNQCTCVYDHHAINLERQAELMDLYIERGWTNKLLNMNITRYDGLLNKIHTFACNLIE